MTRTVTPPLTAMAEAIERLENVFTEIPGTRLSLSEVARMSGLEPEECEPVLDALVRAGFLTVARDGRFRLS